MFAVGQTRRRAHHVISCFAQSVLSLSVSQCPTDLSQLYANGECQIAPQGGCLLQLEQSVSSWSSGCSACASLPPNPSPSKEVVIVSGSSTRCEDVMGNAIAFLASEISSPAVTAKRHHPTDGTPGGIGAGEDGADVLRCSDEQLNHPSEICTLEYSPYCACLFWTDDTGATRSHCELQPSQCTSCSRLGNLKTLLQQQPTVSHFNSVLAASSLCSVGVKK